MPDIWSRVGLVTIVVPDYDEAIAFFTDALGFSLTEDTPAGPHKRWVVVSPSQGGTGLLLAKASTSAQHARIGDQTGGRVGFFLETSDFDAAHGHMRAHGVIFVEAPRNEPYGVVAKFKDPYGNLWDLLERRKPQASEAADHF